MTRVLVIESDAICAERYRDLITQMHHWVVIASSETEAKELLEKQYFHLCIVRVPNRDAISRIYAVKQVRPESAVLVIGETSDPNTIVAAVRAGASHYWSENQGADGFQEIVTETLGQILPSSIPQMTAEEEFPISQFVGRHPKIQEIFQLILSVRHSDSTVLITGESGTGKEVVAHAIHNLSQRRRHPWVAVNCGAIPTNLLESELFGHVKGAFTGATQNRNGRFQLAREGTLFLDEIGDLSMDLQAKLLRAIQNKTYEPVGSVQSLRLDARVIAATNQDLETLVVEKKFREDLFYRLNVIPIVIPPLRTRKSDIPLLVRAFLDRFNAKNNKSIVGITEEAMRCLMQYHWPGNVRELENLVERVVVLKRDQGPIDVKDFPVDYFKNVRLDRFVANIALPEEGLDFNEAVNDFENELILQALQRTAGNKNKAATLLNLNRTTLVEKLKRKGLRISN